MKTILITSSLAVMLLSASLISSKKTVAPITPEKTIRAKTVRAALIKRLEYDNAKAAIRNNYYEDLDQLANTIKAEHYVVSLRGHADAIGKYKYNWVLSDERATEVKKYLIDKGVKEDKIITTPFGSTKPIASNKTPEGRQKNRRVEISLKNE